MVKLDIQFQSLLFDLSASLTPINSAWKTSNLGCKTNLLLQVGLLLPLWDTEFLERSGWPCSIVCGWVPTAFWPRAKSSRDITWLQNNTACMGQKPTVADLELLAHLSKRAIDSTCTTLNQKTNAEGNFFINSLDAVNGARSSFISHLCSTAGLFYVFQWIQYMNSFYPESQRASTQNLNAVMDVCAQDNFIYFFFLKSHFFSVLSQAKGCPCTNFFCNNLMLESCA